MKEHKLRRVYVWEIPVRFFHWTNALAIVVLCVTGYLIGNPPAIMSGSEASDQYLFGNIRFIHFVAAYVFIFNFIFRIYWGFVGNKFASWKNFIPHSKKFFQEMLAVLRIDILLARGKEHLSIGHNALAGFVYFLTFLAFLVQVFTGFGLYSSVSEGWFASLFVWVYGLAGNDFVLRNWHHVMLWFFIVFAMVHIYLVFFHDYVEGRGETSSAIGGWKFIEEEQFLKEMEKEEKAKGGKEKVA